MRHKATRYQSNDEESIKSAENDKGRATAQNLTSRCSVPFEETPLVTPTIVSTSLIVTIVAVCVDHIVSGIINANVDVATDGELEGRLDVKKRQRVK